MVSNMALVFMVVTVLLSLVLPIGLVIFLYLRDRIPLRAVLVGAAIFVVFQMLTRIPLLSYAATQPWYQAVSENIWLLTLVLSVSAALFEETGRLIGFRYLLPGQVDRKTGIAYGLGHGGIEAILLVGIAYVGNIAISLAINSGAFDAVIAPQLGEQAAIIKEQLITTTPVLFLAAGVERVFAITGHVAMSLLVLYAVSSGRIAYWLYAVLFHTVLNFPVLPMQATGYNIWQIELWVAAMALVAWRIIVWSRRKMPLPTASGGTGT